MQLSRTADRRSRHSVCPAHRQRKIRRALPFLAKITAAGIRHLSLIHAPITAGKLWIRTKVMHVKLPAVVFALVVSALVRSAQSATFDLVATHPEVAAQTTYYGDHIATLKPFNGRAPAADILAKNGKVRRIFQ